MISANNITLRLGKKALFEDVNVKFTEGNCYGLIGANGAGKSTFLKILSGQLEPTSGDIVITPGQRLSFLQQDHFKYDEYTVLDTVIMGNKRLYDIMKEKDAIYMKEDFSDEDGIRASELEGEFAEMDGWNAESDAATLLNGLGIPSNIHYTKMADLNGSQKVKVLLAQALFGNPDILLLDEPTNHLDIQSVTWLEDFLKSYAGAFIVISHDRYFLDRVTNRTLEIKNGKLTATNGNYSRHVELMSTRNEILRRHYANQKKEIHRLEGVVEQQRRWGQAHNFITAEAKLKQIERLKAELVAPEKDTSSIHFKFTAREVGGNDVLMCEELSKSYDKPCLLYTSPSPRDRSLSRMPSSA